MNEHFTRDEITDLAYKHLGVFLADERWSDVKAMLEDAVAAIDKKREAQGAVATVTSNSLSDYSEISRTYQAPIPIGTKLYTHALPAQPAEPAKDVGVLVEALERKLPGGKQTDDFESNSSENSNPDAYLYSLEYGEKVVDTKVSIHQLNYPFGVAGADYLVRNDDGVSYVRQTKLYAALSRAQAAPAVGVPVFPERIMRQLTIMADRVGDEFHGPWEDGDGEPLQDDAEAAIAWIASAQPQQKEG